ncbi:MAG TPA: GNAT family N-acetyltransferase [Actinomycetota bacterium]|nr:GNAT family N-acetyltransferase [Actinomycetota bacterium]
MTLEVGLECTERCFELPEWRSLLEQDPNRQLFAYPEWNRAWWEEFKTGKDLLLMTMTRGSDLVAIVPLYRRIDEGRKLLRFVGGIDLTDYLGPICALEDRGEVADALVDWLATTDVEWDELDAHSMPVPLGFAEFLVERADARGFAFRIEQEETAAVLPLPSDWETYLSSLDKKERHELKRKRRRLEREHPDAAFRTATAETLEADFQTFVDMHRGAEGHKGHFMRPEVATFFRRLADATMPLGWLRLDLLEIGGRAVASTFGFEIERKFYLYNSAYEPDAARLSPGLVLVSELVKRSIQDGLELFDFLRGPERYKYQLGAQAVPLNNVKVFRTEAA